MKHGTENNIESLVENHSSGRGLGRESNVWGDGAENAFGDVSKSMVQQRMGRAVHPLEQRMIQIAAHEAAALAWTEKYPAHSLPGLLERKFEEASRYTQRQLKIWNQSRHLSSFAE